MIQAGDFRNGYTIEYEGTLYQVTDFQHVKPGKGAAFVRVNLNNIITDANIERTFRPNERVKRAHIDKKEYEYLYADGALYHFMDPKTFDQIPVDAEDVKDAMKYIKANDKVQILYHGDDIIGVEAPMFAELKITETEPGHRGDTATNVLKPATVETGATVQVPIFINIGDVVKINTEDGDYEGRVSQGD